MFSVGWFVSSIYYEVSFLICVFLVAFRMPHRSRFVLRAVIGVVAFFAVMAGLQAIFRATNTGGFASVLGMSKYIVYYLCGMALVWVSFECNFWAALFCATVGYCLEHLSERLYELINRPLLGGVTEGVKYVIRTVVFAAAVAIIYFLLIRRSKYSRCNIMVDNKLQTLTSVVIVAILVYVNTLAIFWAMGNIRVIFCINIMSIALSFLGIVLESGIAANKNSEQELLVVERILQEERERYKVEKENIELINMKYHDLRYRLADESAGNDVVKELSKSFAAYECTADTGNDALNVVLYRKTALCEREKIRFSCLLDGARLNFISKTDLYSLFGNAIDNAIAAVRELPEEKRIISITDTGGKNYVNIHIENYFSGVVKFVDNMPQTSGDPRFHCYGVKSMRYIAEKYGGILRVHSSGDIFILDILFPDIQQVAN